MDFTNKIIFDEELKCYYIYIYLNNKLFHSFYNNNINYINNYIINLNKNLNANLISWWNNY
jgi:hypothetical protein